MNFLEHKVAITQFFSFFGDPLNKLGFPLHQAPVGNFSDLIFPVANNGKFLVFNCNGSLCQRKKRWYIRCWVSSVFGNPDCERTLFLNTNNLVRFFDINYSDGIRSF